MSLEAFTGWIKDLVATNPAGGDPKSQGDDHIRGLKATLKQQFSGLTTTTAVAVTAEQINAAPGTANSALARANACLPKDGSEDMTGTLRAPSAGARMLLPGTEAIIFAWWEDNQLRAVADAAEFRLDGFSAGGYQGGFLSVPISGGVAQHVRLGLFGKPLYSIGGLPSPTADDQQIVTTEWANDVSIKTRSAVNSVDTGVGVGDVLISQTPAWVASSNHQSLAQVFASIDVNSNGAIFVKARIVRFSDAATMAEGVSVVQGTAGFPAFCSAGVSFQGQDGVQYVAQLVCGMNAGSGHIQPGRGQITVEG